MPSLRRSLANSATKLGTKSQSKGSLRSFFSKKSSQLFSSRSHKERQPLSGCLAPDTAQEHKVVHWAYAKDDSGELFSLTTRHIVLNISVWAYHCSLGPSIRHQAIYDAIGSSFQPTINSHNQESAKVRSKNSWDPVLAGWRFEEHETHVDAEAAVKDSCNPLDMRTNYVYFTTAERAKVQPQPTYQSRQLAFIMQQLGGSDSMTDLRRGQSIA